MPAAPDATGSKFYAEVTDPQKFDSKSVTYLVTVVTDVAEYGGMGAPADEGSTRERRLVCRRRFNEFETLHAQLTKMAGKEVKLPKLPSKNFFNRFDSNVVEERRVAFQMLMDTVGLHESLRSSAPLLRFLSDVPLPEYDGLRAGMLAEGRKISAIPPGDWVEKSHEKGVSICTREYPGSDILSVRSSVVVGAPVEDVYHLYSQTTEWHHWTAEMVFREVEQVEDGVEGAVMVVGYKLPVIDNRDSCVYSIRMPGLPTDAEGAATPGCRWIVAQSVEHPLAPKANGYIRAHVSVSVTTFEPAGEGSTKFTSLVHSDPKGQVPAAVINKMLGVANDQLVKMRDYMEKSLQK